MTLVDIVDIIGLLTLHHRVGLYILDTVFRGQPLKSAGAIILFLMSGQMIHRCLLFSLSFTGAADSIFVLLHLFKSSGSHISSCQQLLN